MRRFFAFIACLLVMSCGSVKHVRQVRDTAVVTDSSAFDSCSLRKMVQSMVRESMTEILSTDLSSSMEIRQEKFSGPDSTGKTHLSERVTVIHNSRSKCYSERDVAKDSVNTGNESKDSLSASRTQSDVDETVMAQADKKPGTAGFVRALAWCGVFALILFVVFVLRKSRLI
ncbi:secreted protein [gut metagenome]|uniref:Secreted protein n=1 Tax=gut metagenome TaxID=749906 RepID=J9GEU8_9ZZZZ